MKLNCEFLSPNYDPVQIPVEFLVLHYTAGDLQNSLELFLDPDQEVSSHLVVDESGEVYELVSCWEGSTQRAWHAGRSYWLEADKRWEEFNNFSIGVEIVNLNGNLFPYTEGQYTALKAIINHLRTKYVALNSSARVIGHEQIAGWRGKVDPGAYFDWDRFYQDSYADQAYPIRKSRCHPEIADSFTCFKEAIPQDSKISSRYWHAVSHAMETSNRLLQMRRET